MKILIVTDMQKDFVDGALGSKQALDILPAVIEKIKEYRDNDYQIIFTMDTHAENYLETQEGRNLPVPHCIRGTLGWALDADIANLVNLDDDEMLEKNGFGDIYLPDEIDFTVEALEDSENPVTEIEFCGLCTGICVLSNAVIVKSAFPEILITVDVNATACVSEETKATAIAAMKLLQFNIIGE